MNDEQRFRRLLIAANTYGVSANVHDWACECGFLDRRGNWHLPASDYAIIGRIEQVADYFREKDG